MSLLNTSSPIAKTAFDSLQAKQSAVSVGYRPIVVRNADVYNELVLTATNDRKLRRQTPLVNAGYASRVLAVSHSIDAFCRYHENLKGITTASKRIQLVFFGCGIDVIGLWADSLMEHQELLIVELDKPEVCSVKKKLLLEKGYVEPTNSGETEYAVLNGHTRKKERRDKNMPFNYVLCPVDLLDIEGLDLVAKEHIDPWVPTLVVSELVLAYLPPSDTDRLLSWCRSSLLKDNGSAMVILEPLGYNQANKIMSMEEGYRREYCRQFGSKMERGKSTVAKTSTRQSSSELSTPFYPIASSHRKVEERFIQAGFQTVFAASLGSVAANTSCSSNFRVPEIFDEHAALALHLSSYTVAVAFAPMQPTPEKSNHGPETARNILMRLLCSTKFAASEIPPRISRESTGAVVYTVMEVHDELAMRNLFYRTYDGYFEKYPAIRKMVNTTMTRELAPSSQTSNSYVATTMNQQDCSEITARYIAQGGCFFIARHYFSTNGPEKVSTGTFQYPRFQEEVVGCVGIRYCERKEPSLENSSTLEIFRLAVDDKFRGQGIGRALLKMAEDFACSRGSTKLIANTLTILEAAIQLYEACGYETEKDFPLGKSLTLRTFAKKF